MSTSAKVAHKAGYTKWGQKLTLNGQRNGEGAMEYSVRREPLRIGEPVIILDGLSSENIAAMFKAVEEDGR